MSTNKGDSMLISEKGLFQFLLAVASEGLGEFKSVILPQEINGDRSNLFFSTLSDKGNYVIDRYRTIDPIKILFYFPRETLIPAERNEYKRLIVGIKSCDLEALKILDRALINDDFVDPVYSSWRENTYIITADCNEILPSCHCTLVDGKPFPDTGYDLNLSKIDNYFFIMVGSKKGLELINLMKAHTEIIDSDSESRNRVNMNRLEIVKKLKEQNSVFTRSKHYEYLRKSNIENWIEDSKDCVGCGACNYICPTCYCIIFNDESRNEQFIKVRSYDACQLNGYASCRRCESQT